MSKYLGRNVLLIAEAEGSSSVLASDGGQVSVNLPPGEVFETKYVQILGKVVRPGQIDAISVQAAGNEFNMENYDRVVELMNNKYSSLFM
jgi:hypothetical protein